MYLRPEKVVKRQKIRFFLPPPSFSFRDLVSLVDQIVLRLFQVNGISV
jgi:hypothetical protein